MLKAPLLLLLVLATATGPRTSRCRLPKVYSKGRCWSVRPPPADGAPRPSGSSEWPETQRSTPAAASPVSPRPPSPMTASAASVSKASRRRPVRVTHSPADTSCTRAASATAFAPESSPARSADCLSQPRRSTTCAATATSLRDPRPLNLHRLDVDLRSAAPYSGRSTSRTRSGPPTELLLLRTCHARFPFSLLPPSPLS